MLLLLAGCVHVAPTVLPTLNTPEDALAAARAARVAGFVPVSARFSLRLHTPDQDLNASGAMLVGPPDHFRVELSGPIGPPVVVVACDGVHLRAIVTSRRTFYEADDVPGTLAGLTGGLAGLDAITGLLLGQFMEPGTPTGADLVDGGYRWTWETPTGASLGQTLGPTGRLVHVDLRAGPIPLMDATYVPGTAWPQAMNLSLVVLGIRAEVQFQTWQRAEIPDASFRLAAPSGYSTVPLTAGTTNTVHAAPPTPPAPNPSP